ncbi:MAG: DUF5693 family protein [Armatimonadota bacterium]|nr:DUF5693 family protein [bacterium]MDW8289718.1 DUF5693 family protein [Armatimonadota bacterium]
MSYRIGWLLILTGVIVCLLAAGARWRAEALNKRVGIVLDGEQLLQFSADTGMTFSQILQQIKRAGATAVALNERSVEDLFRSGQLTWELFPKFPAPIARAASVQVVEQLQREAASLQAKPSLWRTAYTPSRKKLLDTLRARRGILVYAYTDTGGAVGFALAMSPQTFLQMSAGIDPALARQVSQAGLSVVARLNNRLACSPSHVRGAVAEAKRIGAKIIIFSGDEVLGFRNLIPLTAQEMRSRGILYGSVEFGKQKGDAQLSRRLVDHLVRVHSIPTAEMANMQPDEMLDRYVRAVRERNIRLCYVRLPSGLSEQPMEGAVRFLAQLRLALQEAGHPVGDPRPLRAPAVPVWMWAFAGGSALVAGVLLLERLFAWRSSIWLVVVAFALGLALVMVGGETGRKACALVAAIAFPTLGFLYVTLPTRAQRPLFLALGASAFLTLFSVVGGLHVVALLASLPFMVKVNQFAGIKLAHLVPLLLVAWAYVLETIHASSPADVWQRVRQQWKQIASYPVTVGLAGATLVVLFLVALLLMRTGNEPGVEVSALEMKMRGWLEQNLHVRPRTKEFLIGHPALILALALAWAGVHRGVWVPLLLVGVLGQVSVVNTLCHIHTPLALSLPRILLGWALGATIGVLAFLALSWAKKAVRR